jgi:putative transcriptional regulator
MTAADLSGRLLVATPMLGDPNFTRTVILLLQHDDDGAMGVVINRPSARPVDDVLPDWAPLSTPPGVLFQGGPVALDSALGIGRVAAAGAEPIGWRRLRGDVGLIDLDTPTELVAGVFSGLRIFAGYAGWGSDQLEGEIDEGA